METQGRPKPTCPHCGGTDIVRGVRASVGMEGPIGLEFRGVIFTGTEPLLADLCKSCGTVARLWVRRLDREWRVTKP